VDKTDKVKKICESLDKKIGNIVIEENELYSYLDTLAGRRTLKNADKHIIARNKLIEHLTKKKVASDLIESNFSSNEAFLHTVLTHDFNILYDATLNEDEKKQLVEILSISDKDLNVNFKTLQEEVTEKMINMIKEETKPELIEKLSSANHEAGQMKPSKFNYYKLLQLKNGI
jgi:succinate dehydrogenase flavin-adding protein (antitoxin of CptAB toxin-antitoxin module)